MDISRKSIMKAKRLIIRSAVLEDVDLLFELWTAPSVIANVGYPQGLRLTEEQIRKSIIEQDRSRPFGRYLIVENKENKVSIGECNMKLPDENRISRTDVKLLPKYWSVKFGVEIKQALVDFLFDLSKSIEVFAISITR